MTLTVFNGHSRFTPDGLSELEKFVLETTSLFTNNTKLCGLESAIYHITSQQQGCYKFRLLCGSKFPVTFVHVLCNNMMAKKRTNFIVGSKSCNAKEFDFSNVLNASLKNFRSRDLVAKQGRLLLQDIQNKIGDKGILKTNH